MMSGDSVGSNIFVIHIMQGIFKKPPESTIDRVLVSNFRICWYYHLSLSQTGYGSVSCQPLAKAHTVQRGHSGRYRRPPVGMPLGLGAWVFFPVGTERGGTPLERANRNLIPCYVEVVASPLRVLLGRCRG